MNISVLNQLGLSNELLNGGDHAIRSPIDGSTLAKLAFIDATQTNAIIDEAHDAFLQWRTVPAPIRGELVRVLGELLREHKEELATVITLEAGKIQSEALGEVQEMIDICDFAVGLSRQLYGLTIASERPGHHMRETWHPLGVVGVITAFNFPMAVWSWNTALALICGNAVVWKPSEKTPLTALACQAVFEKALERFGKAPKNIARLVVGARDAGNAMVENHKVALVSATGSTRMGREVGPKVAARFGRSILELGGNNAMILTESADLDLAVRAIVFSAVGTAGQRCTTLRRLIIHKSVKAQVLERLKASYSTIPVGSPLDTQNLVGPLMDEDSFNAMQKALSDAKATGGVVHGGERVLADQMPNAYYVKPAIVEMPTQNEVVATETFAPILYVMEYEHFSDAMAMNNDVPQGLSSCIFTNDVREAEFFQSAAGSDCGIANVNIGTSGAEIGGAFGGEKETGGGRESGSDSWKGYMRRQTNTINYSRELPLAQGVKFD
ncbi:Putative aldehyde dehydrogenase family 7 member A1 [Wohlfahrtiimonas chitiniclastica SH04]|uniref:aldehyde dehydrogenase (NAD(+)) n=1 Tax=Wohlfahrtiimonas chitiniclastica SH04 TaxID=1261130 RepID=L8XZR0_9GAMM|nr:aldehyde dehydrogenase family protein [Wohlfahrtiimonas chitiniclastica]ELV08235.1 Putative aldehyde dehydrogenase family 7 member A1 [Wohlfahrtiimonas chitiniclastica SH04]MBS7820064.1 aldehyde dehydrogenase family protein [Wohlfahrtiimonas chitiniclastica]MBS7828312.1 aldehyde dehydrogenase family protein [Wohlfahrtiimonas chitiniclastica]MDC7252204.1 aldehyde dehydrogenase [Wohlfahrtiimonas chitiniclastica]OYQ78358.1 aldehyde dehydrogenase family protein [Wohlfahrtiimonas chitiniclastica